MGASEEASPMPLSRCKKKKRENELLASSWGNGIIKLNIFKLKKGPGKCWAANGMTQQRWMDTAKR